MPKKGEKAVSEKQAQAFARIQTTKLRMLRDELDLLDELGDEGEEADQERADVYARYA